MEHHGKFLLLHLLLLGVLQVFIAESVEESFSPNIAASCKAGYMEIKVMFPDHSYTGAVHARDIRKSSCMKLGDGTNEVVLRLPLIDDKEDPDYCGVRVNQTSKEKYVPVAVRIHETLELADDKFYVIKCGLQGFFNNKNETSFVNLQLLDTNYKKTKEAIFDRRYILRADISQPDNEHRMRVKNCFSHGEPNHTAVLTDAGGCPDSSLLSPFVYNDTAGTAEAELKHMFKFPDSNRVSFQCEVLICKVGKCEPSTCASQPQRLTIATSGRALPDGTTNSIEDKSVMVQAGTTVYVVEPSAVGLYQNCEWYPPWLWILCIALAVLFIIMMIINIFLCSAMTCSCTNTEIIEKEPSIIEEYDPYRSWHGSQYGSRYSLNGKGYTSGASTMNSARSVSSHSDHYAIVHSRPNSRYSRYSGHHSLKHEKEKGHRRHRDQDHEGRHHDLGQGPPSTTGSHYSAQQRHYQ